MYQICYYHYQPSLFHCWTKASLLSDHRFPPVRPPPPTCQTTASLLSDHRLPPVRPPPPSCQTTASLMSDHRLPPVRPPHSIMNHLSSTIFIHSHNVNRPSSFRSASISFTVGGPGKHFVSPVIHGSIAAWPVQFHFHVSSISSISGSWVPP